MMKPWAIIAALLLALGAGVQTYRLQGAHADLAAQARELADKEAIIADNAQAAAVHRAWIDRLDGMQTDQAALQRDLQLMEGRDAPLSDHLRAAAGRLWP